MYNQNEKFPVYHFEFLDRKRYHIYCALFNFGLFEWFNIENLICNRIQYYFYSFEVRIIDYRNLSMSMFLIRFPTVIFALRWNLVYYIISNSALEPKGLLVTTMGTRHYNRFWLSQTNFSQFRNNNYTLC